MRVNIPFQDRVGIAHEILAVLARRGLNVLAVEVAPPNIFIDIPDLTDAMLPALQMDCDQVPGVGKIQVLDILPGLRRQLNLETMMAVMEDPVIVIDAIGKVVIANAAAAAVAGMSEEALCQKSLMDLLGEVSTQSELISNGFRVPSREVILNGEPFLMDVTPVSEKLSGSLAKSGQAIGALLTLHAPRRIGGRLHLWLHFK